MRDAEVRNRVCAGLRRSEIKNTAPRRLEQEKVETERDKIPCKANFCLLVLEIFMRSIV
jgi:hypothetical protein